MRELLRPFFSIWISVFLLPASHVFNYGLCDGCLAFAAAKTLSALLYLGGFTRACRETTTTKKEKKAAGAEGEGWARVGSAWKEAQFLRVKCVLTMTGLSSSAPHDNIGSYQDETYRTPLLLPPQKKRTRVSKLLFLSFFFFCMHFLKIPRCCLYFDANLRVRKLTLLYSTLRFFMKWSLQHSATLSGLHDFYFSFFYGFFFSLHLFFFFNYLTDRFGLRTHTKGTRLVLSASRCSRC